MITFTVPTVVIPPFHMGTTLIISMMDICIIRMTGTQMSIAFLLQRGTLIPARPHMAVQGIKAAISMAPLVAMRLFLMGIISITWWTDICTFLMGPTVTTMGQ